VLAAATVVNLPFGTVYAFSVFLKPMEALLGMGRAEMAIVFSMASIFLTVGMLIGPALYRRFAPVPLLLVCGALSASGLLISAAAQGIEHLLLGYGVLFGLGGGVVFIMMQQGLNQTISPMSGLAGWLYDQTQSYDQAMRIAAGVNLLGALLALSLPATARSLKISPIL
jgi:hypothetical protein